MTSRRTAPASGAGRRIRPLLQAETSECGLVCLAMVAQAYGLEIELPTLRERFGGAPRGSNLRNLVDLASDLGLRARPVRLGLHRLSDLRLPALLHWRLDHYVVLERTRADGIDIIDPAIGRRRVSEEEANRCFSGVALELTPGDAFEPQRLTLSRQFRTAWFGDPDLRRGMALALLLTLTAQVAVIALPWAYRTLVDSGEPGDGAGLLQALLLGAALLVVAQAVSAWARSRVLARVGALFVHHVSSDLVERIFSLPLAFFQRRLLGEVMARTRSVEALRRLLTEQVMTVLVDVPVMAILGVAMLVFSPLLGSLVLTGVAIELAIRASTYRTMRDRNQALIVAEGREQGALLESLRAIQAIKLAGAELARFVVWQNANVRTLNASLRASRVQALWSASSTFISSAELLLLMTLALLVPQTGVSIGVLVGFITYRGLLRERLGNVLGQLSSFEAARIHLQRLDDVMLSETEPRPGGRKPSAARVDLTFEEVTFGYGRADSPVLSGVNLEIPDGSCVAFIGPSGAGKSTLAKLLLRFETPQAGMIRCGGRAIAEFDLKAWRSTLGVVMQDDQLLTGSIAENIAFFDPEIDMDRVREVSRMAALDTEIEAMAMEYGTLLGDMGLQVSGGQKQRILIARALYRRPRIILLDEGTANLDAETEQRIAQVLDSLEITRIVIAHRSYLVDVADAVYEVRDGAVRPATERVRPRIPA